MFFYTLSIKYTQLLMFFLQINLKIYTTFHVFLLYITVHIHIIVKRHLIALQIFRLLYIQHSMYTKGKKT